MRNMRYSMLLLLACHLAVFGQPANSADSAKPAATESITLGAGCFWCTEAVFEQIPGVVSVTSGYMGGSVKKPTYEQVCTGQTGHAEVTRIVYDPSKTR